MNHLQDIANHKIQESSKSFKARKKRMKKREKEMEKEIKDAKEKFALQKG